MKRILFTVSNDLTTDQRMQRICTSLQNAGYDVCLIGRKRKHSRPIDKQVFQQKRLSLFFEKGKLFYLALQVRLFFYLCFSRFDAVCAVDLDTILPAYWASKLKGKKCYYDAHELFTEVPEVVRRKAIRRIWLLIEKYACTRKSIIAYTVSNAVADELKHRYGKSFKVIRNFPYYKKTVSASKERIILYRGAVNEGRGLEVLIAAMKNIDAKLLIAGDGDITLSLQKLTEKLNLHHKIIFTGYLSPDELDQRSSQACIGVNLLDASSLNYYYSLANKFFDYVQLQIPQVCMNYPEYREMNIQHQVALLIDELKIEVVEQALQELLNNTALYHHLLLNCKMAAKEWCWQNEEKKLLDIYKD